MCHKASSRSNASAAGPKLMTLFLASMLTMAVNATGRTKLVVNIVVDGLRLETLDQLSRHLSDKGFNRLIINGVTIENVDFGTNLDPVASTAMLLTGAAPSVNGIPSATVYDPVALRSVNVLDDGKTIGNYTDETYSLSRLAVTTLADEIRIAGGGVTYAYAISPDAMCSLLMGGHAANSAVWINDKTANWASTTYYKEFPTPAANANRVNSLGNRLDTITWTPASGINTMALLPDHLTRYPFRYTFPRSNSDRIYNFKRSPLVNDEVTRLATEYISGLELGRHDGTDILSLGYTLVPYDASKSPENRYEQIDAYIKLDAALGRLFAAVDKNVGEGNALFVLSATPPPVTRRVDTAKWQLPGGVFSTRKAVSLLNMYLMAIYGNGEWVSGYHDSQIFLNHDLIKQKGADLAAIRQEAARFLERMSGVSHAWALEEVLNNRASERPEAFRRNVATATAADVYVSIAPGWQETDDDADTETPVTVTRAVTSTAPFFLLAPNVTPRKIDTPVDARVIAPTVCRILRIRSPNGASLPPLRL